LALFTQWPQITELSRELDLDRTEVLNWVKEFSLKPERLVARHLQPHWGRAMSKKDQRLLCARCHHPHDSERQQVLAKRGVESRVREARERSQRVADAAQPGLPQHPQGQQGFIPFYSEFKSPARAHVLRSV
jgi:hypothetical protein